MCMYSVIHAIPPTQILDFGLARHTDDEMTGYVATRWYRAPEIMLNWMHYNMTGTTSFAFGLYLLQFLSNRNSDLSYSLVMQSIQNQTCPYSVLICAGFCNHICCDGAHNYFVVPFLCFTWNPLHHSGHLVSWMHHG